MSGTKKPIKEIVGEAKNAVGEKAGIAVFAVKKGGAKAVQKVNEVSADVQRQVLQPVFKEDFESSPIPEMIRICAPDKQHLENPVCKDSVGHMLVVKDMKVLNLYPEHQNDFELEFYPQAKEDVYYKHPFIPNRYVNLNNYFNQIRKEKVDELERIASSLGAKYVKVSLFTQKKSFTGVKGSAGAAIGVKGKGKKAKAAAEASIEAGFDSLTYEELGVSSESKFKGHEPERPALEYFSNESDILALIENRLSDNTLYEKTYKINYSDSSKINATAAMKIDAALKKMKLIDANATVSNQVEEESRLAFNYHIEFPRTKGKRMKGD